VDGSVAAILDPLPGDAYRYRVELDGQVIGFVGRSYRMEQGWYFKNDAGAWGHNDTRRQAVDSLVEMAGH
jgi:hypothetical protein